MIERHAGQRQIVCDCGTVQHGTYAADEIRRDGRLRKGRRLRDREDRRRVAAYLPRLRRSRPTFQTGEAAVSREPFDPADPFDAMAESFRLQVCDMVIDAQKVAIFKELSWDQQIQAITAGVMTGLVGVLFAHVNAGGRDGIMEMLEKFLPMARQNAEDISDRAEE